MITIQAQFAQYVDGNGLMSNAPVPPGTIRASDNGPLFTSQYLLMLLKSGQMTGPDITKFSVAMHSCIDANGNLHRAPGDPSEDAPDDYYGVAAAYSQLSVKSGLKLPFNLWRQPQLLFAVLASNQSVSRWKFWQWPLAIYTALVVLTSDIRVDKSNADARILAWLLIQATKDSSTLVKLASVVWFNRLYTTYPNGMADVAAIYFLPQGSNPYSNNWITR